MADFGPTDGGCLPLLEAIASKVNLIPKTRVPPAVTGLSGATGMTRTPSRVDPI
jgi:hypothetical protein